MTKRETVLRRPLDMRQSVAVEPSFPLTLTLSLREREQPPPSACFAARWTGRLRRGLGQKTAEDSPSPKARGPG